MLYINYIDREDMPTPYIYINVGDKTFKFSMVEDGTVSINLKPHEAYFIMLRVTKQEDVPNNNCFENIFFGKQRLRIISRTELYEKYNINDYQTLLNLMISDTSVRRIGRIITGDVIDEDINASICLCGNLDNITIKTLYDIQFNACENRDDFADKNFYSLLWDSFSLISDGVEYKSDYTSKNIGDNDLVLNIFDEKYIEFTIKKYKKFNFLEENSNNDTIYVYSNGNLDKEEVSIIDGYGKFRVNIDDKIKDTLNITLKYNKRYIVNDYKFIIK